MAKPTKALKPLNEATLPVSKRHLQLVQKKIEGDLTTMRLENREGFRKIDARFAQIDARFTKSDERIAQIDTRFAAIDERFAQIDARFASIDTQLASLDAKITRMLVIIEEQNDRNRVAMDGFMTVYEKLIEHEKRFQKIEKHVGLY